MRATDGRTRSDQVGVGSGGPVAGPVRQRTMIPSFHSRGTRGAHSARASWRTRRLQFRDSRGRLSCLLHPPSPRHQAGGQLLRRPPDAAFASLRLRRGAARRRRQQFAGPARRARNPPREGDVTLGPRGLWPTHELVASLFLSRRRKKKEMEMAALLWQLQHMIDMVATTILGLGPCLVPCRKLFGTL